MASSVTTRLYVPIKDFQWPIIYSTEYDVTLCGIERLQAYDTSKGRNVFALLKGTYTSVFVIFKTASITAIITHLLLMFL